ncbi:MAG: phosphoribosylglycinamide formyltransferase [Alphaproteobacteria bacterium]|jgi:phosphoribosylglycinamide formyltransferase-1|nr:phosphoribosylglycinamide formyltransferase [Alphaproteobacteria bacterium]
MARLKLVVLISGRGSNLQALIDACAEPDFPAEISLIISNRADAGGLTRAETAGIATAVVPHGNYPDRETFDSALSATIADAGGELICLAGFMRVLTAGFVDQWRDRLINIHPSLLPAFRGLDTHARALAEGVRLTGCTVHYVRTEVDAGPIIVQAGVPVMPDDDEATLATRVLAAEHQCYPLAVRLIAEGRTSVHGESVTISGPTNCPNTLINPSL